MGSGTVKVVAVGADWAKAALVDDDDYENVLSRRWRIHRGTSTDYAADNASNLMHRWLMGADGKSEVDHLNGLGLDNRKRNLRVTSRFGNQRNVGKPKNNTSGYKGVVRSRDRWAAQITANNRRYGLGTYDTPEEAARAYDEAALRLHGSFAKTNAALGLLGGALGQSGARLALVGKMGSGKSTLAEILTEQANFVRMALADALKDEVAEMLNLTCRTDRGEIRFTRKDLDENKFLLRPLLQFVGTDWHREFLGESDRWIRLLLSRVGSFPTLPIVVDDARFVNEAEALRAEGFTIVKVVRNENERIASLKEALTKQRMRDLSAPGGPVASSAESSVSSWVNEELSRTLSHKSEQEIEHIEPDILIANDDLATLRVEARRLAGKHGLFDEEAA
jgi:energy-coupling factor transporter ATP-binding protein EcfA2